MTGLAILVLLPYQLLYALARVRHLYVITAVDEHDPLLLPSLVI